MTFRFLSTCSTVGIELLIVTQLIGCASSPQTASNLNSPQRPSAATISGAPVTPPPSTAAHRTGESPTFAEPQPTITVANRASERPSRLINLYGELNETSFNAGSQFDGGSNLTQVTFATEGACVDPDLDRTGQWLAFASTMHRKTSDIYIKSVTGKTQTQLTSDPADDVMPAFNPGGSMIAFASNRSGNWDIYTTSLDGSAVVQITNDSDHELHPSWSPDGRTIAYCKFGTQSQRWEIWTVDATNPGVRNFLDYGLFPQWCPDPARSKILFQRAKQRGSRDYSIWTVDVIGGQAKYPTEIVSAANAALINPSWSPAGDRVVFVSVVEPDATASTTEGRPAQSDLWIIHLDGTQRTSLTNGRFANFQPVWANNGTVYFVSDRSGTDNVWAVTTSTNANSGGSLAGTPAANIANAGNGNAESHP